MSYSPQKYLAVKEKDSFKCDHDDYKYPIVYPLVILHCIIEYKKSNSQITNQDIRESLTNLQKICEKAYSFNQKIRGSSNKQMEINTCLSSMSSYANNKLSLLYPIKSDKGIGLALIDKTDGIYPLIFYPDDDQQIDKGDRVHALKATLDTILKPQYFSQFMSKIDQHVLNENSWGTIKNDLMSVYPSKRKSPKP